MAIFNLFNEQSDVEAMLPRFANGFMDQGSEAFRTTGGSSMMFGAANMTVKDIVRNYDYFTESVVGALVKWNSVFGSRPDILGDFDVVTCGATSLVAKEMRSASLDQMNTTMTPQERSYLKTRKVLEERFRARDLDPEELLKTEAEAQQDTAAQAKLAQDMQQSEIDLNKARASKLSAAAVSEQIGTIIKGKMSEAQIKEILSRVDANLADVDLRNKESRMEFLDLMHNMLTSQNESPLALPQELPTEIRPDIGEAA